VSPSLLYNAYQVFPRGKAAGVWRWPPTTSSAEVKERVELPLLPVWAFVACSRVNLYLYLKCIFCVCVYIYIYIYIERERESKSSCNGKVWWRDVVHTMMTRQVQTDVAKADIKIRIQVERSGVQILAAPFFSSKTSGPAMGPNGYWGVFPGVEQKDMMLKAHLHLVPTFRINGFIPISLKYNQQDTKFSRSIYLYKLLYIFQAVPPPIIRSTKLYIQRQVLSNQYCYLLLSWMR
jgi:hypothetical protein